VEAIDGVQGLLAGAADAVTHTSVPETVAAGVGSYPNVQRWLANMKKLKNWDTINEVFTGFATANKGKEFVRLP
jgi:hypothetical protein